MTVGIEVPERNRLLPILVLYLIHKTNLEFPSRLILLSLLLDLRKYIMNYEVLFYAAR